MGCFRLWLLFVEFGGATRLKMNPKVNGTFFASIRTNYGADAIKKTGWLLHQTLQIKFSWNLWNIVSRRVKKNSKFLTFPGKMEILAQPIDQSSWIKFRGPVLNQQSSLQNFRFPTLSTCSEQTCHKISLGPHFGVTRKDPDVSRDP